MGGCAAWKPSFGRVDLADDFVVDPEEAKETKRQKVTPKAPPKVSPRGESKLS